MGKTAIVTGAARGIGQATARAMLHAGANVVLNAREEHSAFKETLAELQAVNSARVAYVIGDISDPDCAPALAQTAKDRFGSIDVLVNNAGIIRDQGISFMQENDWDAVIRTNLKGAFLCCKAVTRQMVTQRSGRIINVSSITALSGRSGQTNYGAAKAGLIGLTKSLARELASKNVLVNALAVGVIETRMTKQIPRETLREVKAMVPMERVGRPEEVANTCLFLASDMSSYITGTIINVSGGAYI
jgi:3-oxoacyl-[acyl-carrier protein] reductase